MTAEIRQRVGGHPRSRSSRTKGRQAKCSGHSGFCGQDEPIHLARRCSVEGAAHLRHYIAKADHWLELLASNLPA